MGMAKNEVVVKVEFDAPSVMAIEKRGREEQKKRDADFLLTIAARFSQGAQFVIQQNDLVGKQMFAADALTSAAKYILEMPDEPPEEEDKAAVLQSSD